MSTIKFNIAGVQFRVKETPVVLEVINNLNEGDILSLLPEPSNRFDPNAVRIIHEDENGSYFLGYVPVKFSADITSDIEIYGITGVVCKVTKINKGAKLWELCEVEITSGEEE